LNMRNQLAIKPNQLAIKPNQLAIKPNQLAIKPNQLAIKPRTTPIAVSGDYQASSSVMMEKSVSAR
jgi:hypothetical protein